MNASDIDSKSQAWLLHVTCASFEQLVCDTAAAIQQIGQTYAQGELFTNPFSFDC